MVSQYGITGNMFNITCIIIINRGNNEINFIGENVNLLSNEFISNKFNLHLSSISHLNISLLLFNICSAIRVYSVSLQPEGTHKPK
jgi:hypothetical protein